MDKLGTLKICPKCEHERFGTDYIPPVTQEQLGGSVVVIEEEYMKRTCQKCNYTHKEAPLDAIESKGEQDA